MSAGRSFQTRGATAPKARSPIVRSRVRSAVLALLSDTRLVLGLPGRAPVMSAIRDKLHWLSYPQRVTFKLCLTTYKCLHGLAPHYHRDLDFLRHINTLTYLLTYLPHQVLHTALRCRRSHTLAFYRSTQTVRPPHVYIDVWFTGVFLIEPVVPECSSPISIFRQSLKTHHFNNNSD